MRSFQNPAHFSAEEAPGKFDVPLEQPFQGIDRLGKSPSRRAWQTALKTWIAASSRTIGCPSLIRPVLRLLPHLLPADFAAGQRTSSRVGRSRKCRRESNYRLSPLRNYRTARRLSSMVAFCYDAAPMKHDPE